MSISLSTPPYQQFYDANGDPLSGGKIYTYLAGTTTPRATYTDQGGLTQSANPIILDSAGRAEFWLDDSAAYKFVVKDSSDVTIHTTDNVQPFPAIAISSAAWTAYSPTVSTGGGSIATLGTVTGRYWNVGKSVAFQVGVPITSAGTGSGHVSATLPFAAAAFDYVVAGREKAATGKMLQGHIEASSSIVKIFDYTNSYPGVNSANLVLSGIYEKA